MSTISDGIKDLNNKFLNFMLSPNNVEKVIEEIYDDLVDEVLMGFVFDAHRRAKCGIAEAEEGIVDDNAYRIVDTPGRDVFGEPMTQKTGTCSCSNCEHIVSANRFATHLERCLGMGRNSSRAASRRISDDTKDQIICSDDENDGDWSQNKKRKRKNAKKRMKKVSVTPKDDSDDVSASNTLPDL